MARRRRQQWKPKDIIILVLISTLIIVMLGEIVMPLFLPIAQYELVSKVVGATVSGILLILSNYLRNNGNQTNNRTDRNK